jgi:hypothetical protein
MKHIVISQSMYFPWVGLLEQIRLADVFVHYDDVQYTRGGFINRVQIKTPQGVKWLTLRPRDRSLDQRIDEVLIDDRYDWRSQHRDILRQAYLKAPFRDEMLALVDRVYAKPCVTLADVARSSVLELADYFDLVASCLFVNSTSLDIGGSSSQRVFDTVSALKGNVYITGHGARNYLDHQLFERANIEVRYMQYRCVPYPQLHGDFTPYVTGLDLVANCGRDGARFIQSGAVDWKEFIRSKNG